MCISTKQNKCKVINKQYTLTLLILDNLKIIIITISTTSIINTIIVFMNQIIKPLCHLKYLMLIII